MADAQVGNAVPVRFVDKRKDARTLALTTSEAANYGSIASMKTRLTALKPSQYTTARMNTMTVNDLQYALRVESADSAGIK